MRKLMVLCVGALLGVPAVAGAATMVYGDKPALDLVYRNVREDSTSIGHPLPLFGNPSVVGNSLVFSPVGFSANATGAGGIDMVDSTLNTALEANAGKSITTININEAGDYTLIGAGTAATQAVVTAPYFIRITEVNNAALLAPITVTGNVAFSPSGGTYDLVNDPGAGIVWSGSASINVPAILAANSIPGAATKVLFTMDNQLIATSEAGTSSFIKKKTGGVIITVFPEPTSLGLIGGTFVTLLRRRR